MTFKRKVAHKIMFFGHRINQPWVSNIGLGMVGLPKSATKHNWYPKSYYRKKQ